MPCTRFSLSKSTARSSSVRLVLWKLVSEYNATTLPLNWLPPSFGMMLALTPLTSDSTDNAPISTVVNTHGNGDHWFGNQLVAHAEIIAARNRGVDVRWVTDDEHGLIADTEPGHGQFAMLQNAGIEVRSDDRTALMHNKFWIFDGEVLWTGSTNITKNGIFVQDNNAIVFSSPQLAAIYEREFQEMWDGRFGPKSPSQLAEQSVVINGTPIQVIFTSEDPALESLIVPMVSSANSSVRFLAFSFTDFPLADAMVQRAQQGVNVAGVIDKTQSGGQGSELGTLFCANIPVRQDGNPQRRAG